MARQAAKFGDLELTRRFLADSLECGYYNSQALLRDPWFESLRSSSEFATVLSAVQDREANARRRFAEAGGEQLLALQWGVPARLVRVADQP